MTYTENSFSISVYHQSFTLSLPPHARSCCPACQKMTAFYNLLNCVLNLCSDSHWLNSELQYLKAVAIDRGYDPSIVHSALFKLQHPPCSNSHKSPSSNNSIILLFFPKSSLYKILSQFVFRIIFTLAYELTLSKLKNPIEIANSWDTYSINYQCSFTCIG